MPKRNLNIEIDPTPFKAIESISSERIFDQKQGENNAVSFVDE